MMASIADSMRFHNRSHNTQSTYNSLLPFPPMFLLIISTLQSLQSNSAKTFSRKQEKAGSKLAVKPPSLGSGIPTVK